MEVPFAVSYGRVGGKVDIHNAILKVASKKGFVLPGHKYTRLGNPLEKQLKYNPETGEIHFISFILFIPPILS